ncbi:hypothetical protein SCUP515_12734 [Seiridium cupressi]
MAPQSIAAAIGDGGMSTLYFVDDDNRIAIWQAQEDKERPKKKGGRTYVEGFAYPVDADKATAEPLEAGGKDLAAIAYYDDESKQICTRLYYQDKDHTLRELCKDGGSGQWYEGSLSQKGVKVAANTTLAAMEGFPTDPDTKKSVKELKVYYFKDDKHVYVAWAIINSGDWQVDKVVA